MPYDSELKKLYVDRSVTPNKGITLSEIAECLRDYRVNTKGQLDLGMLCTSPNINIWAKYKPFRKNSRSFATEEERLIANFGLDIMMKNDGIQPSPNYFAYEYLRPRGDAENEFFRIRDFDGYVRTADDKGMLLSPFNIYYSYKGAEGVDVSFSKKEGAIGIADLGVLNDNSAGYFARWEYTLRISAFDGSEWHHIYVAEWQPMFELDDIQSFHIPHETLMEGVGITGGSPSGDFVAASKYPMFLALMVRQSYGSAEYNTAPNNVGVTISVVDIPNIMSIERFNMTSLAIANNMAAADMSTGPITPEYYNGQNILLNIPPDGALYLGFKINNTTSTEVNQDQVRLRLRWTDGLGETHIQDCPMYYYGTDALGNTWQDFWSIPSGGSLGSEQDNRTSPRDWMIKNEDLPNIVNETRVEMWLVFKSSFTDTDWTAQTDIITINRMEIV